MALEQHVASAHFKQLEEKNEDLIQEPFEVNILEKKLTGAAAA